MPTNQSLVKILDKAWEGKSLKEVLKGPVSALQGVTPNDAKLLEQAFKIRTVEDLAKSKFVLWAQAIATLAAYE